MCVCFHKIMRHSVYTRQNGGHNSQNKNSGFNNNKYTFRCLVNYATCAWVLKNMILESEKNFRHKCRTKNAVCNNNKYAWPVVHVSTSAATLFERLS